MRIIIILSLLGLTACNVSYGLKDTPISGVHSDFKLFVDEYCDIKQEVLNLPCNDIPMQYGQVRDKNSNVIRLGECRYGSVKPHILINKDLPKGISLRQLIYHEMIHCDLEYHKHDDSGLLNSYHQSWDNSNDMLELRKFFNNYKK
ncbi:MAG TPA: hypothetical protein PLK68_07690 [Thomasclavelia ramosa]|nr:hypothetical protein [Thomasclavelia ramosa]